MVSTVHWARTLQRDSLYTTGTLLSLPTILLTRAFVDTSTSCPCPQA